MLQCAYKVIDEVVANELFNEVLNEMCEVCDKIPRNSLPIHIRKLKKKFKKFLKKYLTNTKNYAIIITEDKT